MAWKKRRILHTSSKPKHVCRMLFDFVVLREKQKTEEQPPSLPTSELFFLDESKIREKS